MATQVELHETFTEGTMAGMRPTTLTIGEHSSAELQPGGAHFMVFDITEQAQDVPFELTLEDGTTAWIRMPVTQP
jgi:copper(I)-binding protein